VGWRVEGEVQGGLEGEVQGGVEGEVEGGVEGEVQGGVEGVELKLTIQHFLQHDDAAPAACAAPAARW